MKKTAIVLIPALALLSGLLLDSANAFQGGEVRNGGDVRRYRSLLAVRNLAKKLADYTNHPCEAPTGDVEKKLQDPDNRIAKHLSFVRYEWIEESQGACVKSVIDLDAWTLRFSYTDCPDSPTASYYPDLILGEVYRAYPYLFEKIPLKTFLEQAKRVRDVLSRERCDQPPREPIRPMDPRPWTDPALFQAAIRKGQENLTWILEVLDAAKIARRLESRYPEETRWFAQNQAKLRDELAKSPLDFTGKNLTCGATTGTSGAPLVFSFRSCREFANIADAQWLILHEIVHHAGVEDEIRADFLAYLVLDEFYPANWRVD